MEDCRDVHRGRAGRGKRAVTRDRRGGRMLLVMGSETADLARAGSWSHAADVLVVDLVDFANRFEACDGIRMREPSAVETWLLAERRRPARDADAWVRGDRLAAAVGLARPAGQASRLTLAQ